MLDSPLECTECTCVYAGLKITHDTHTRTHAQSGLLDGGEGPLDEEAALERAHALRRQLSEVERAMWDSGAHVHMQRLMEDFQAKVRVCMCFARVCVCVCAWM